MSPDSHSKDDFFPSDQFIIDHNDLDSYSSPLPGKKVIKLNVKQVHLRQFLLNFKFTVNCKLFFTCGLDKLFK